MSTFVDNDVKKIYEKSVRLLNDKQARLMNMRQILKKAVIRLTHTSRSEDEKMNSLLDNINETIDDHIDLDMLNSHLDSLFVLTNHVDFQPGRSKSTHITDVLNKCLNDYSFSEHSKHYHTRLKKLINNKLTDEEVSTALLDMLNDSRTGAGNDGDLSELNEVILEMLDQLTLHNQSMKEKNALKMILERSGGDKKTLVNVINKIVVLVNDNIKLIQQEKENLETYLSRINTQLSDIESFVHVLRNDDAESKSSSLTLTTSVENTVSSIEEAVSSSTDLDSLKENVTSRLQEIRDHVLEYIAAEENKAKISAQTYEKIIDDLINSQREATELKEQLCESKNQLLRDPLTGIPNRLAFEERLEVEVHRWKRSKAPLCLAMWDIDHFKKVNDTYGHGAGDKVLSLFTDLIQSSVRKVDLFARVGGEEFILLMPDTDLETALMLNNRLREKLEECNFHYDGHHCPITASVGIAAFEDGCEAETVIEKADAALYQSKNNGRNQCTTAEKCS